VLVDIEIVPSHSLAAKALGEGRLFCLEFPTPGAPTLRAWWTLECPICGTSFVSSRLQAAYCSPECRGQGHARAVVASRRRRRAGADP
jgi:hypothetical protein